MQDKPSTSSAWKAAWSKTSSPLNTFNWDQPAPIPANQPGARHAHGLAALLWTLERPWVILIGLATLIGLGFLFKQTEDRRRLMIENSKERRPKEDTDEKHPAGESSAQPILPAKL
jgi:hypothetical protein